jgi:hypothetical protein
MRRIVGLATFAVVSSLSFAACSNDDAGTGRVSVLLTDAPGDIKAAVVTVSKVYLQGSGGETVLTEKAVTTNLLTLQNDVKALVNEAPVPAGIYSQLRFVIDGAYIEVDNGNGTSSIYATSDYDRVPLGAKVAGTLKTPSMNTSGLKVDLGKGIRIDGDQKVLLVDFDVSQSFGKEAGQSGQWVMTPVLKATDVELTGSVKVALRLADGVKLPSVGGKQLTLADFKVRLTVDGGDPVEAPVNVAGSGDAAVEFKYLFPGKYAIELVGPAGVTFATNPVLPPTVQVGSGASVTHDLRITFASAK